MGELWTDEESQIAIDMYFDKAELRDIGKHLGRAWQQVGHQLRCVDTILPTKIKNLRGAALGLHAGMRKSLLDQVQLATWKTRMVDGVRQNREKTWIRCCKKASSGNEKAVGTWI